MIMAFRYSGLMPIAEYSKGKLAANFFMFASGIYLFSKENLRLQQPLFTQEKCVAIGSPGRYRA